MTKMFPDQIESFQNKGEKVFYRFIEHAAKPDTKYMCWYNPYINNKEPDFIIYCEDIGLLIIEVKGWMVNQISLINTEHVTLDRSREKNPLKQARGYFLAVMDRLQSDGRLVYKDGYHHGELRIPISYGVAFPNITRREYEQYGIAKVIPSDRVFLWDELHPDSEMAKDASGRTLLDRLKASFPPLFKFNFNRADIDCLREILYPEVIMIKKPKRSDESREEEKQHAELLDRQQEAIARQIDTGHRILRGPSGSGKTLVLIHWAVNLLKFNPKVKRVLFVCYNVALVNYIKQLFAGKGVPIGTSGVEVLHFYELCSKIIGESVQYEKQDMNYYNLVVSEALDRTSGCSLQYDLILLDEGQDFSNDMLKVVAALLNKKTNHMMIAIDENQDIYKPERTWQNAGIDARGRVRNLTAVYRNTTQISQLAGKLIGLVTSNKIEKDRQERLFDDSCTIDGPTPEILRYESYPALLNEVAKRIESILAQGNITPSDIAVLYTRKDIKHRDDTSIPEQMKAALESKGILSTWVSEDYRSKRDYDITTNRVAVSTIHSVKGMDYHCVFLVGIDLVDPNDVWTEQQLKNLVYVGITRARFRLVIPYVSESGLVRNLLSLK